MIKNYEYKSGDIIFLTRRKSGNSIRKFISFSIALFTKNKGQKIDDVKVHAAIIYEDGNKLFVREMDKGGNVNHLLSTYIKKNFNRLEIVRHKFFDVDFNDFNYSCKHTKVNYDYKNTFLFQVIKSLFGKFIGKNTKYSRMCAEDVQRQFNLINCVFDKPEQTNPNELYNIVENNEYFYKSLIVFINH